MKYTFITIAATLMVAFSFGQAANRLSNTTLPVKNTSPYTLVGMDTTTGQLNAIYAYWMDSLRLRYINIPWTKDSAWAWGQVNYRVASWTPSGSDITTSLGYTPTTNARTITINGTSQDLSTNRTFNVGDLLSSGSYANPSWITSLAYAKLTGTPTIPTNNNQLTNGSGYITSSGVPTLSFNNAPGITIQTVAASGNGNQISSTRSAFVNYSVTITTTVSLSGNATGYVVLEICPTNSSTAGDWIEIGRAPSGQSGTLVIGLTLTQSGAGQLGGVVPPGYYRRVRSVNTAGTPTYTYNSGQEVLY